MKIFNIFFVVIFIIFAGLQYNDPDPYVWMPIYLYGAVCCYLAAQKKFHPIAYVGGSLILLAYAVYLFFDKTGVLDWAVEHHGQNIASEMKASTPWIEETREFFGLFIVIGVMMINLVYARRMRKKKA